MARILFIVYNFPYFYETTIMEGNFLEPLHIWDKGLNVWGSLLGIFLSLFLLARSKKEDFYSWADILVVGVFFGMCFAYIGAFLDGRSYGSPTELPWGVIMEPSQYAIPIHPVQLYAAFYTLLIGLLLFHLFNHDWFKKPGIIALSGLTLYSLLRFLEEFLRGDETILIFETIREAQIWSALSLFTGGYMLYRYFRNYFQENS
jgi:phosphatidylglycerol:prolipoprotein diacylglycerol transferase